jgi:hypothetical protein
MQTIEPHCVSDDFSIMPYDRLDDVLAMNAKIHEREIVILATTAAQVNYWARIIQAEIADRPPASQGLGTQPANFEHGLQYGTFCTGTHLPPHTPMIPIESWINYRARLLSQNRRTGFTVWILSKRRDNQCGSQPVLRPGSGWQVTDEGGKFCRGDDFYQVGNPHQISR